MNSTTMARSYAQPIADALDQGSQHDEIQVAQESQQIPLVCHICPKISQFSDISHLLTHVASKGHLQNEFNLKLKRDSDRTARMALDRYNTWSTRYNIEEMLRVRSESRQKRQQKNGRVNHQAGRLPKSSRKDAASRKHDSASATRAGSAITGLRAAHSVDHDSASLMLKSNARCRRSHKTLTENTNEVKLEPEDDTYPAPESTLPPSDQAYSWQTAPGFQALGGLHYHPEVLHTSSFVSYQGSVLKRREDDDDDEMVSQNLSSDDEDKVDFSDDDDGSFPSENIMDITTDAADIPEIDAEEVHNAKFRKGEWLVGMDVFDAASPEQRRKRNQRKDPSVLRHMQSCSEAVLPSEMVTDIDLIFQRQRNVYDSPSIDGSDMEEALGSNKKGKSHNTQATQGKGRRSRPKSKANPSHTVSSNSTQSSQPIRTTRGTTRRPRDSSQNKSRRSRNISVQADSPMGVMNSRMTRSSRAKLDMNGHFGLPGHNNPDDPDFDVFRHEILAGDAGSLQRQRRQDTTSTLALRPGNANLSLLSSPPGPKCRASRPYSGKENQELPFQMSTSASNPYLNSNSPLNGNSYNPLCVQPRDEGTFRMYPAYDEDIKPPLTGFNPINNHDGYNTLHMIHGARNGFEPHRSNTDYNI